MPKRKTETTPNPELARRLVQARTWVRASQEDVAGWAGISRRMVVDYESGLREPPLRVVRAVAQRTGSTIDWIVGDDEAGRPGTRLLVRLHETPNHGYATPRVRPMPAGRRLPFHMPRTKTA
jgi:transcriptional regulator with XRE-family HTH domain